MSDQPSASHDSLARLIHAGGRREAPPAQAYERALAATTQVWETKVRRRHWRMTASFAAGIAMLFIGAGVAFHSRNSRPPIVEPIATVARVIGAVRVRSDDSREWMLLHEESGPLVTGAVVRTDAESAVALQLAGVSVRIADHAEIMLESQSRLRLMQGKVYVDTGDASVGRMLVVSDMGSVTDVGTQFEVQVRDGDYRVRIREGEVLLERAASRQRGVAGQQISIDRSGAIAVSSIAADDPAWQWVQTLAAAPDIDDQPLTVLLAWVARETGGTVRYASPAVERKATATILHGSIRHLEPLQALAVMLATTDLRHEVLGDGTIMIQ